MKIHIVMHESFESPAAIEQWALGHHHELTYTRTYEGDHLPEDADGIDFLVVMGGPQDPDTKDCPHFNSKNEQRLISQAIEADKFVLGVCLGAQLIGEALGARFEHSPKREIGVFNLTKTAEASTDPVFSSFPNVFPVGHWHGDMPGLTQDSVILAYSEGCPRQIVRYTPQVYGFQCHFEFTPEAVEGMIESCGDELATLLADANQPYIQDADRLRSNEYGPINAKLFVFLDHIQVLHEAKHAVAKTSMPSF